MLSGGIQISRSKLSYFKECLTERTANAKDMQAIPAKATATIETNRK